MNEKFKPDVGEEFLPYWLGALVQILQGEVLKRNFAELVAAVIIKPVYTS